MPRGRPSKLLRTTALSAFIQKLRQENGWTQPELEEKLGISSKHYVSKLETGSVQNPKQEVYEALARLTGKSVEELSQMAVQPPEGLAETGITPKFAATGHTFALAFGHCVWASPILVAEAKGLIPNFKVCSYFETFDTLEPVWLGADTNSKLYAGQLEVPGSSSIKSSMSAADALRMLERNEVDIAAVPGNLIGDNRFSWLVRVGSVVDSSTGCTLVCDDRLFNVLADVATKSNFTSDEDSIGLSIPSRRLGAKLQSLAKGVLPNIAVEPGTIAEEVLDDALCDVPPEKAREIWRSVKIDFRNRELGRPNAISELTKQCPRPNNGIGVITWQPHATWAKRDSLTHEYQIPLSRGVDARPRHLTFEVVMRLDDIIGKDARSRELRIAVHKLMQSASECATELNEVDSNARKFDTVAVDAVARYFDLGHARNGKTQGRKSSASIDFSSAIRAIGGIRFSVKWDIKALELMGFKPA